MTKANLIDEIRTGLPRQALEKAAEGGGRHVRFRRQYAMVDLLTEMLQNVFASRLHPLAMLRRKSPGITRTGQRINGLGVKKTVDQIPEQPQALKTIFEADPAYQLSCLPRRVPIKGKTCFSLIQKPGKRNQLRSEVNKTAGEVSSELQDFRLRSFPGRNRIRVDVRQIAADQTQVALGKRTDMVADQARSLTSDNIGQLDLRVVMQGVIKARFSHLATMQTTRFRGGDRFQLSFHVDLKLNRSAVSVNGVSFSAIRDVEGKRE